VKNGIVAASKARAQGIDYCGAEDVRFRCADLQAFIVYKKEGFVLNSQSTQRCADMKYNNPATKYYFFVDLHS